MREIFTSGSVGRAPGNRCLYPELIITEVVLPEKRLAIAKQLKVGRFILKIDGDGPVFAGLFGCFAHVSPLGHQVSSADETR